MSKYSDRHKARRLSLQALYQWQASDLSMVNVQNEVLARHTDEAFDRDYFKTVTASIATAPSAVDELFAPHSSRSLAETSAIELAILRIATYELSHQLDLPKKVVLNEAIELAKKFGANDSYQYINGVLDKTAQSIRPLET